MRMPHLRVNQLQLFLLFFKQQHLLVEQAVVLAPLATTPHLPVLLPQLCGRLLHSVAKILNNIIIMY